MIIEKKWRRFCTNVKGTVSWTSWNDKDVHTKIPAELEENSSRMLKPFLLLVKTDLLFNYIILYHISLLSLKLIPQNFRALYRLLTCILLQVFLFSEKVSGMPISRKTENTELPKELRELLHSPLVLNELRKATLFEFKNSTAFETNRETYRTQRSYDIDRQRAHAIASLAVESFVRDEEINILLAEDGTLNKGEKRLDHFL